MPIKKVKYDGEVFDSQLEVNCYKALKDAGIPFVYHVKHEIFPGFVSSVTSYDADKRKGKELYLTQDRFGSMSYTPDFQAPDESWFIETKGFLRPEAAMRIKLFKMNLTREGKKCIYIMPHNKAQIMQAIEIIKESQ